MAARNLTIKNDVVITKFGTVHLDAEGIATNLDELNVSPEQLIAEVPGFVEAAVFKANDEVKPGPGVEQPEPEVPAVDPDGEIEIDPATGEAIAPVEPVSEATETPVEGSVENTDPTATDKASEDEEAFIWETITALSENPKNLNTEGYVNMGVLNETLKAGGKSAISGTLRKSITDKFKAQPQT